MNADSFETNATAILYLAALALQALFVVRDAGMLIRNWTAPEEESIVDGAGSGSLESLSTGQLLLIDAIFTICSQFRHIVQWDA